MSRLLQPQRLHLETLAQSGQPLAGQTALAELPRLVADAPPEAPAVPPVAWQATAQWRTRPGGSDQLWLRLEAQAQMPLVCQRCLAPTVEVLDVDRWFRFVDSEAVAEAEDDESEEDLLVMAPQFDLLALLEDELLMALPLVPMHPACPQPPVLRAAEDVADDKPHPFAALAQLRTKPD